MANDPIWLSTSLLLKKFHPNNPREHFWGDGNDLDEIKKSLIGFGWLTYPTLNTKNGNYDYLLSGHGRILVADNLRNTKDSEWWADQWKKWLKDGDREDIQDFHQERFNAFYWDKCPVILTNLDEFSSEAALIRLNNTAKDGQDNPNKLAAILAKLPKKQVDLAGWDESTKKVFIQAYIKQAKDKPKPQDEFSEDYDRAKNTPLESYDNSSYDSGDDYEATFEEQLEENKNLAESSEDLDHQKAINKTNSYNYDPTNQTRFLLYFDKELLPDFKKVVEELAIKLDIDQNVEIHQWRSRVIYEVVTQYYSQIKES